MRQLRRVAVAAALAACALAPALACAKAPALPSARRPTAAETAFLDTLERRTFRWFWDLSDARTGLTPDRAPTRTFASTSATGFALTAYPIGVERGWVSRDAARERTLVTLRFFATARMDTAAAGATGIHGFYYHFLDDAGVRYRDVELSTIDTAWLLCGVLFAQAYFDRGDAGEAEIRTLADTLLARADWRWANVRPHLVTHGWDPEHGFLEWDWRGMNESMIVPLLAIGSDTHRLGRDVYDHWLSGCTWSTYRGQAHVGFPPLFGHQWTLCWLDLRGLRDSLMAAHGLDWPENTRRATLAQRDYALANPGGWRGYGERLWGLTACDGPIEATLELHGRAREFRTYDARGAGPQGERDDGTVAPTAAAASLPFAPDVVLPVLRAMHEDWPDAWNEYGFVDAFNPTLDVAHEVPAGRIVPGVGWFDRDQLGIDQGPILIAIENHRTGFVWKVMRKSPYVVRMLKRAGFRGGWLDRAR